ncbi:uncharacterized protein cubi_02076 [Cryptosporidium ubiquitum]|uniref:Uncharacterized protein n=1 Tax=Cryptosporidium ubiquitum TaxID=857276 RepID=A0A1J4MQ39_9CRYT|nr:uncharacterized protein cubi_02076 [Cryptosporidium ubiquitum]OII75555.1 hypothetical protein cubi_02076 [Cryptosporidium ubiquitum]
MFCTIFDQLIECCKLPNESIFSTELEFELESIKKTPHCQEMLNCIHASGSCFGNILNYNSFRPNTSIRYLTSNLHQRYGTKQLSLLPKYEAILFEGINNEQNKIDNELVQNLIENDPQIGNQLLNFIQALSKGIMVKQVLDLTIGDTKYIAMYLSKNLSSLILDNFGGVLLEVPLKFVIDVVFSDFSNDKKTLINEFTIRKGYEPVKLNEDIQYLVSIDLGTQMKSICLTFSSEIDGMSFCTNLCKLISYLNLKRIG